MSRVGPIHHLVSLTLALVAGCTATSPSGGDAGDGGTSRPDTSSSDAGPGSCRTTPAPTDAPRCDACTICVDCGSSCYQCDSLDRWQQAIIDCFDVGHDAGQDAAMDCSGAPPTSDPRCDACTPCVDCGGGCWQCSPTMGWQLLSIDCFDAGPPPEDTGP